MATFSGNAIAKRLGIRSAIKINKLVTKANDNKKLVLSSQGPSSHEDKKA